MNTPRRTSGVANELIDELFPGRQNMNVKTSTARPSEFIRTHTERLAQEAEERLHKRQLVLAEQCAIENPPEVRIRAWETAHALRLPSNPEHPVLRSVATRNGPTNVQGQEEQSARQAPRTAQATNKDPADPT